MASLWQDLLINEKQGMLTLVKLVEAMGLLISAWLGQLHMRQEEVVLEERKVVLTSRANFAC